MQALSDLVVFLGQVAILFSITVSISLILFLLS